MKNVPAILFFILLSSTSSSQLVIKGRVVNDVMGAAIPGKDYSNWLPGQGGFLDRVDSFLLTGAVYYLLCIVIFKDYFSRFTV